MNDNDQTPVFAETVSWGDANIALTEAGLSDGLPLIPPTEERLAEMLKGVRDPQQSHGMVAPMFGDLTAEAIAYNCVLAGCEADALPVVLTALKACLAPEFNLLGLLTTTGTPAIATIVHGPAASALGMNAGTNCLGPGNRANATIGRAISLSLRNIGGARETVGDMATMGQPGKYGFCFAEGEHALVPLLSARRGLDRDTPAVTVLGVSGTIEVLPLDDRDTPEAILQPIAAAMMTAGAVAGAGREREAGEQFFLLPPELADAIGKHGWDLVRMQDYLFSIDTVDVSEIATFTRRKPAARSADDICPVITGGPGVKMTCLPIWAGGSRSQTLPLIDLEQ